VFGISGGLFSLLFGYVARCTATLVPQIVLKFVLSMGLALFILSWTANVSFSLHVIFTLIFILSITESIATVQIRGMTLFEVTSFE
jgi:hypothetical protein